MVAAAYKTSISIKNAAGQIKSIPFTASDVAGEYWLFPSGGSEIQLSSLPCAIYDVTYTAAGTDTSAVEVYVNGINTGVKWFNALNLTTGYNRQVQSSPLILPAGCVVKFKQVA